MKTRYTLALLALLPILAACKADDGSSNVTPATEAASAPAATPAAATPEATPAPAQVIRAAVDTAVRKRVIKGSTPAGLSSTGAC